MEAVVPSSRRPREREPLPRAGERKVRVVEVVKSPLNNTSPAYTAQPDAGRVGRSREHVILQDGRVDRGGSDCVRSHSTVRCCCVVSDHGSVHLRPSRVVELLREGQQVPARRGGLDQPVAAHERSRSGAGEVDKLAEGASRPARGIKLVLEIGFQRRRRIDLTRSRRINPSTALANFKRTNRAVIKHTAIRRRCNSVPLGSRHARRQESASGRSYLKLRSGVRRSGANRDTPHTVEPHGFNAALAKCDCVSGGEPHTGIRVAGNTEGGGASGASRATNHARKRGNPRLVHPKPLRPAHLQGNELRRSRRGRVGHIHLDRVKGGATRVPSVGQVVDKSHKSPLHEFGVDFHIPHHGCVAANDGDDQSNASPLFCALAIART